MPCSQCGGALFLGRCEACGREAVAAPNPQTSPAKTTELEHQVDDSQPAPPQTSPPIVAKVSFGPTDGRDWSEWGIGLSPRPFLLPYRPSGEVWSFEQTITIADPAENDGDCSCGGTIEVDGICEWCERYYPERDQAQKRIAQLEDDLARVTRERDGFREGGIAILRQAERAEQERDGLEIEAAALRRLLAAWCDDPEQCGGRRLVKPLPAPSLTEPMPIGLWWWYQLGAPVVGPVPGGAVSDG